MYTLCSLQFQTSPEYQENLDTLAKLIQSTSSHSLIVAPEVSLTGFDYSHFSQAQDFAPFATQKIKELSKDNIIVITMIERKDGEVYNIAKIFHKGEVVYERAKAKLFTFGGEEKYFSSGKDQDIEIITVDGMKIAVLVCFELRFKELWKLTEGADIIVVPAWWGKIRADHFKSLTKSLAIINQCYVIASDSANEECSQMSGIITPMGVEQRNGNALCLKVPYDVKEIVKMRRYMDVGIG